MTYRLDGSIGTATDLGLDADTNGELRRRLPRGDRGGCGREVRSVSGRRVRVGVQRQPAASEVTQGFSPLNARVAAVAKALL